MIYALNTKNDEHEAAIQTLKEAHEEEVQQILSETREKIMQYKSKISDEMDLKRRIQSLEDSMELHERMKRQALAEFETYRQRVEDMQLCTEAQHTQRVVTMSREVEEMRRSFEERLRSFGQVGAGVGAGSGSPGIRSQTGPILSAGGSCACSPPVFARVCFGYSSFLENRKVRCTNSTKAPASELGNNNSLRLYRAVLKLKSLYSDEEETALQ